MSRLNIDDDQNDASERWREGRNHLGAVGVLW